MKQKTRNKLCGISKIVTGAGFIGCGLALRSPNPRIKAVSGAAGVGGLVAGKFLGKACRGRKK